MYQHKKEYKERNLNIIPRQSPKERIPLKQGMKYRNVITLVVFGSNSIIVNARKFPRNDKINQKGIQYLVSREQTPHSTSYTLLHE